MCCTYTLQSYIDDCKSLTTPIAVLEGPMGRLDAESEPLSERCNWPGMFGL